MWEVTKRDWICQIRYSVTIACNRRGKTSTTPWNALLAEHHWAATAIHCHSFETLIPQSISIISEMVPPQKRKFPFSQVSGFQMQINPTIKDRYSIYICIYLYRYHFTYKITYVFLIHILNRTWTFQKVKKTTFFAQSCSFTVSPSSLDS